MVSNLKKALPYLPILLLLGYCSTDRQSPPDEMPSLHDPPVTVALNTDEGYTINPLTGDSIEPIINRSGDTLKTGVPLPVSVAVLDPDIVAQAEVIPAGKPKVIPTHSNVYEIPEKLTVIPVNVDSLKKFVPGTDTSSFILVNSRGDTIPTGVPIPIDGTVVPCRYPQPYKSLPPRMTDNACINIRHLTLEQGLNASGVHSILEDRKGNLWFGSPEGLILYNGETFTHFTENEGLGRSAVNSILEDLEGNLWFGTSGGGVNMYNGETFTHFTESEGLSNNIVYSILEDSNGNLWFGTFGGGVSMYNGEVITHFTEREGLSNNYVYSLLEDRQGNIWIGTDGGGVNMYNGEVFTHITEKEGLSSNNVHAILEDNDGNLWFCTDGGGVTRFNGENFTYFTEKEGLSNIVESILQDRHGNIWFGTGDKGVIRCNGELFANFTVSEGLSGTWVESILEDSQGNLWFGALDGGVNIYKAESFTFYTEKEGLVNKRIRSILEDIKGSLWFGTMGGGLVRYNVNSFENFTESEGLSSNRIRSILEDDHENIWFSTGGAGVTRYDGGNFTHFGEKQGFISDTIRTIFKDSHGDLWFGIKNGGVIQYNGEAFSHISGKKGSSDYEVWSIIEDNQGNLWFGTTHKGMIKYNGKTLTFYTQKEGLCDNTAVSLLEDSHGNLWIGTRRGVSVFDGETFTHYTDKQGLCNNIVMSILEDRNGFIWLSTDRGLSQFVFDTDGVNDIFYKPKIYSYGFQDGLKNIDFYANARLLDSKNRIWWGSLNGTAILDLNTFKLNAAPPSDMKLIWIEINEQFADYRHLENRASMKMEFDSVAKFYNYPLNLKLPYRHNHLSFHYSATDWSAPQKLLYSYNMVGLDDTWSKPSPDTYANYRNLSYGTFTFKVRAIGASQKWSETFEYTFTIRPPWWYSWWAYLIYGFIILSIIYQYRRYLMNRAKLKAAVEIERIEKEKVQELDHMKSRFFANISHEFRTPLSLLLGPINTLQRKQYNLDDSDRKLLGTMKRNTRRLQQLINQLLDLSKLDTGEVKLQLQEGDMTGFVRAIVLSFLSLAETRKIEYLYDIPEDSQSVLFDADKIEKILTNLITNAFKFTSPGGEISVVLKYLNSSDQKETSWADISVRDTGKGIPPEMIDKIFDRFFQVSSIDTRDFEGTGIGLALTRELVDIYKGHIKVESEVGKGSHFRIRLPVSRDQFNEDEMVIIQPETKPQIEIDPVDIIESASVEKEPQAARIKQRKQAKSLILIVEDNSDLRKYISQHLLDDYQVREAGNGKIGFEKAKECIPDLVVSDLMMPEMDGIEMCKRLRNDERTSHIPIIMLTARADRDSKLKGLETGADDYIIKPFDAEELLIRINNLIMQRKKLQERFLRNYFINDRITGLEDADERFLRKAKDIIDSHISDPEFKTESFSRQLGLSRSQLYRKLQGLTNQSPSEFIRKLRLKHSLVLLAKGFDNIAQIAYQVGFSDPSYYAQCFRKLYGVSPSEYASIQRKPRTASSE